jgi:hypothetical protein
MKKIGLKPPRGIKHMPHSSAFKSTKAVTLRAPRATMHRMGRLPK